MYVALLSALDPARVEAGGKARSLARMIKMGLPVPAGFVVFPAAFSGAELRAGAQRAIRAASAELWPEPSDRLVAVRSSGVAEDSAGASFAGEFATELNVALGADLFAAIQRVRASRHSDRLRSYLAQQGLTEAPLAIVVQAMIPADLAGVLFTVEPVHGQLDHMAGSAVRDLGEALVSGETSGLPFRLLRPHGRLASPEPLPELKAQMARQLYRYSARLEKAFGAPQDIEWAAAGGKLYLLQSRPITTLQGYDARRGDYNSSRQGEFLWTNSNFGEAIPDVMTPATWSAVKIFMRQTVPFDFLDPHPFMGNIGGRFYMNLSLMASLFFALGFSRKRLRQESAEFFGHLPDSLEIPVLPLPFWRTLRGFIPAAIRQAIRVNRNRAKVAEFATEMPAAVAELSPKIGGQHTAGALRQLWISEIYPLYVKTCQMLQAGTSGYENRYRKLHGRLQQLCSPADCQTLLSGLSSAGATLASLGPLLGLVQLRRGELSREEYQRHYGHRGPHEYELSWPRPHEDPAWLHSQLAHLEATDPEALLAGQRSGRAAALARLQTAHPRQFSHLQKQLDAAAQAARTREHIRSEMVRAYGLIRQFYLRAGQLLALDELIFFLEYEELLAALGGALVDEAALKRRQSRYEELCQLPPYPGTIIGRFDPDVWAADPDRRHDLFVARGGQQAAGRDDPQRLSGFPGAAGRVQGRVRLLARPEDGHTLAPGEILVAATTNVGWTPLFPKAAAIITDVGAPLSHAAIVARELGIPAVVGTGDATRRLKDGDMVELDGGAGWVRILTTAAREI